MRIILGVLAFLAAPLLPLFAGTVNSGNSQLPRFDDTMEAKEARSARPLLDYRKLVNELVEYRRDSNRARAQMQQQKLAVDVVGQRFRFADSVDIKRESKVSRDLMLWCRPDELVESKLSFSAEQAEDFARIQEDDYIEAEVELLEIGKYLVFRLVSLQQILPFNPQAGGEDFNGVLRAMQAEKIRVEASVYRDRVLLMNQKKYRKYGLLTGVVESIEEDDRGLFCMNMTAENQPVRIECSRSQLASKLLARVEAQSKQQMAVRFRRVREDGVIEFFRGVPWTVRQKDGIYWLE